MWFFGNSLILDTFPPQAKGAAAASANINSFLSRVSRKLQASIVFFTGRFSLPIPYRQPIHMAIGATVSVEQKLDPSLEEVQALMDKVAAAVTELYSSKKPNWESRPLVML